MDDNAHDTGHEEEVAKALVQALEAAVTVMSIGIGGPYINTLSHKRKLGSLTLMN